MTVITAYEISCTGSFDLRFETSSFLGRPLFQYRFQEVISAINHTVPALFHDSLLTGSFPESGCFLTRFQELINLNARVCSGLQRFPEDSHFVFFRRVSEKLDRKFVVPSLPPAGPG